MIEHLPDSFPFTLQSLLSKLHELRNFKDFKGHSFNFIKNIENPTLEKLTGCINDFLCVTPVNTMNIFATKNLISAIVKLVKYQISTHWTLKCFCSMRFFSQNVLITGASAIEKH